MQNIHKSSTVNRAFTIKEILLIKILTATVFIGRAWQHLFWDIPFRTLLWDEALISPIINRFGMTWETYIYDMRIAAWQEAIVQLIGIFYLFLGGLVFFVKPNRHWIKTLLWISSFLLLGLSLLYWKEQFYRIGQLIEYTIQWSTPILLILAIYHLPNNFKFRLFIKIAIAATFIGHGLYAFGFYPTPGNFIQMVIDMFRMNDTQADFFLKTVGVLDFIAAVGIFLPKLQKPSLIYCIIWGFATAFARIFINFDIQFPIETLHQWLHQTIYRLPHGGIPLLLWLLLPKEITKHYSQISAAD